MANASFIGTTIITLALCLVMACGGHDDPVSVTNTPTSSRTPTPTLSPTPTATSTPTPTATSTPAPTATTSPTSVPEPTSFICGGQTVTIWLWELEKSDTLDYWNFFVEKHNSMVSASDYWLTSTSITLDGALADPLSFLDATDVYLAILDKEIAAIHARSDVPGRAMMLRNVGLSAWETERQAVSAFKSAVLSGDSVGWNNAVDLTEQAFITHQRFEQESLAICDYLGG